MFPGRWPLHWPTHSDE